MSHSFSPGSTMLWVKLYRSPAVQNAVYTTSGCSTQGQLTPEKSNRS